MRLQQLEIAGFKSFSDRSHLSFDRGVTAIVGPNGCGKSNVADAITWVLGEQSAKSLRGDRMEDVIFNGSDARKPTGTAEVRLRLSDVLSQVPGAETEGENGDGDSEEAETDGAAVEASVARTVEVTRRLYRSGESEYLIDGQICRLRDVHEFLMDTGLGAKAYAIIEQGKIGMILSSRPADRRQLIEEAAGITKYKARRRAAELKLEAAQQNLTRLEDIIFELEKQFGSLKRQAAKARRYRRLRDEIRHWEKVLFAGRFREFAQAIVSISTRLSEAKIRESSGSARLAQAETDFSRLRVALVEVEGRATNAREAAHACELDINRRQQQIEFDRQQIMAIEHRLSEIRGEIDLLTSRREPGRVVLEEKRQAAVRAEDERQQAARALAQIEQDQAEAHRRIEGFEGDVEAARSHVFSSLNAATALRHAVGHAEEARGRVSEELGRLDAETADVRLETERSENDRAATTDGLRRAQQAAEASGVARAARETELATARIDLEWRSSTLRAKEHDLAALAARLTSLEELDRARAGYTDAARMVLAQADGNVRQQGAIADYLEVAPKYERAVEACLGELLQYVIVSTRQQAMAGLDLIREQNAGRCGFLVLEAAPVPAVNATRSGGSSGAAAKGLVSMRSVVKIDGRYQAAIEAAIGETWIADDINSALAAADATNAPVATLSGEVFRGQSLISGGGKDKGRGILAIKREIKELRDRIGAEQKERDECAAEVAALETRIAQAASALSAINAELHREEKAIVALELQLQRATEDLDRLRKKDELLETERNRAAEERRGLEARQLEARESIARLEQEQKAADERLSQAQRHLFGARETVQDLGNRAAEAKAAHATLVERAAAIEAEVARLVEVAGELETRTEASQAHARENEQRLEELRNGIVATQRLLDGDGSRLDELRTDVRNAEDTVGQMRQEAEGYESAIREARKALDHVHAELGELEVAKATAESRLSHLASACLETLQLNLDEVLAEVERMAEQPAAAIEAASALDDEEAGDEEGTPEEPAASVQAAASATPEERIAELRGKIDRMGPVNMMAIDQFDELSTRHTFLTPSGRISWIPFRPRGPPSSTSTRRAKGASARRSRSSTRIFRSHSAPCSAAASPG